MWIFILWLRRSIIARPEYSPKIICLELVRIDIDKMAKLYTRTLTIMMLAHHQFI